MGASSGKTCRMAQRWVKLTKSSLDSGHVVHFVAGQLNIQGLDGVCEGSLVAACGIWTPAVVGDRSAVCTTVVEVCLHNHRFEPLRNMLAAQCVLDSK